jgi:serine/threonine-protein kinase
MAFGAPSVSRTDDAIRRLGRYQIIGRLATGGMAEVYLALSGELPGFRTLAVVKRILPHLASNGQFIRMFLDEARLAALLDHPNIVRIMEVGHDDEEYFLAMELVQGKPLSAVLRKAAREKRPPSAAMSAYLIAQAAAGLGYAHTLTDGDGRPLGVVHRDVSPQNVLISFEGAVKLIDFGVARAFGRVAHTSPGGLKGKIDYMSPEQASAEDVDHRADVFALGVVLWEALTGRRLFRRDTELATMRAIVDDPIPKPSELTTVPPELEAIAMRALRKRRDARFQTAHEMASALERYAFAQEGFSPIHVATYMKSLFTSECLQWRKTATAALDMEVDRPQQAAHPSVAALTTEAATMALRPGAAAGPPSGAPGGWVESRAGSDVVSRGGLSPARVQSESPSRVSAAGAHTRRDRWWVYGGLTVLAAIMAGGAWVLTRPPGASITRRLTPITTEPATATPPTNLGDTVVTSPAHAPMPGSASLGASELGPAPAVEPAPPRPAPAAADTTIVPQPTTPVKAAKPVKEKPAGRARAYRRSAARAEGAGTSSEREAEPESKPDSPRADPFAD